MEHTKQLLSVPLTALVASPFNVRRYSPGQVEELAALIDSQGLLHNLVVTEQAGRRGTGKAADTGKLRFAVAAGEASAPRADAAAIAGPAAEGP